jgi:hypothetical protein
MPHRTVRELSMATDKRKGRNSAGHVDPFYQRRRRFEAFFRAIGLQEVFARMPRHAQEFVWKLKYPDPILEFDSDFPTGAANRALRDQIEKAFRGGEAELPHGAPDARISRHLCRDVCVV